MTTAIKMPKRFDYSASYEFNDLIASKLAELNGGSAVLDCSDMSYIDSAGIGLLVMAHKKAMAVNSRIELIGVKPAIKEIFLLANLQKLIQIK